MNQGFRFKQFYVRHDRCAMKVGTDGVLLGAWTPVDSPYSQLSILHSPFSILNSQFSILNSTFRVLDIGTGSGLVALMLAQRCPDAVIDAIDIDESAVTQAAGNFYASPWPERLRAFCAKLQDWKTEKDRCYNLIVSNPPYFQNSLKNPDKARELARHTDSLSYEELFAHSARLLTAGGRLALILPAEEEEYARELAERHSLYLTHVMRVYSKLNKPARRVLMEFVAASSSPDAVHSSAYTGIVSSNLVLEDETGGRSADYREMTKDFYL